MRRGLLAGLGTCLIVTAGCANVPKDEMVAKAEVACLDKSEGKSRDTCVDNFLADRGAIASKRDYDLRLNQQAREDRYAQGEAMGIPKRDRDSLPIPPTANSPGVPPAPRSAD